MYEGSEYIVTMIFNHRYRYFVCGVVLNLNNLFTLRKKNKNMNFNLSSLFDHKCKGNNNNNAYGFNYNCGFDTLCIRILILTFQRNLFDRKCCSWTEKLPNDQLPRVAF